MNSPLVILKNSPFSNTVLVRAEELICSSLDELTFSNIVPVRAEELIFSSLDELTFSNIVPVRAQELILSSFDELEEFCLIPVWWAKWWETTQQDIGDDAHGPHVYF